MAVAALPLLVPAVVIAIRRPLIDWGGDRALTELGVRQAARFHQLLGMGGRFGWRHPGPMWLQLLVPGYELTARAPWSLSVGVLAIHIACIVVAVLGIGRAAPVLAAAICLYVEATGLVYWTNLWAGYAFTWPVLTLIVLGAIATTEAAADWALPGALLVGTLLVQTDVSTAVPVVAVGAVAIGVRARRHRLWTPSRPAVALVVLTALAWVPPVIEELTTHPGNLTLLWRFATHPAGGHPLRSALASTGAALSVVPLGARWVMGSGLQQHLGAGPWWLVAWTLMFLAANVVVAIRADRPLARDLALLTAVATVAGVVAMTRVDGPISFYLVTWISILPVTGITAVVIAIVPETPRLDHAALALAGVLAAAVIVTRGTTHDWDKIASADIRAMTARVDATVGRPAGRVVGIHVVTADTWPQAAGVALQLQRQGARIQVDKDWVFLFGDAFKADGATPTAELWFARPHELPALTDKAGMVELGAVDGVDVLALSR